MNTAAAPVRREQVDVDGTSLSYLTGGNPDAPPLLLLHDPEVRAGTSAEEFLQARTKTM